LDEARVALEAAKTTLNNVASDVKNPNKQAELQKTLRTVTNASKQISGGKNSNPKTNETTLSPTLIPAPMNYGGVNYGDVARKPTPRPESFETPNNGPVDYTKVFLPGEVDRQARILSKPIPDYTEEARKNNVQGVVELRVVLAASGEVSNIRVVQRLPFGLSERAVVAAKQLKFTPAMKDGRAVSQSQVLDYKFGLY
jgi:TonB family protein